jgi:HK97 family phage portal protein
VSFQDVWGKGEAWDMDRDATKAQMSITATLACVDIKAASIAAMPLKEYTDAGGIKSLAPSKSSLIDDPSDVFSPEEWIYAGVASLTLWDQAIGMVTLGKNMWPAKVEWLVPSDVQVGIKSGRTIYVLRDMSVHSEFRHGGDIVHIRRRPIPGRADGGLSASKAIAPLVQVGLEGARAALATYLAGGLPMSALYWDGPLDAKEADDMSESYVSKRRKNTGRPLVLGKGWKFETFKREDITGEMVAMRQQIATEVAVAHSVPPELVGGTTGNSLTYSTLEGLTRHLEVRTLLPVYTPFERAMSRLLPDPRFCRFNADAVIRTSLLDRMKANDIAIRSGVRTPNEARALDDVAPFADGLGDEHLWPPYAVTPATPEVAQ